jgi:hypothetical protein
MRAQARFWTEPGPAGLSGRLAAWRPSSHSAGNGCSVQVACLSSRYISVRDARDDGRGPLLLFSSRAWREFIAAVKTGQFG